MIYELTEDKKEYNTGFRTHILTRIKATVDLPNGIKAGDLGGWIEFEHNLQDKAWIGGEAKCFGDAIVGDRATVMDRSIVCDNAWVSGKALIRDNSLVCNSARVAGNTSLLNSIEVGGSAIINGNSKLIGKIAVGGTADINNSVLNGELIVNFGHFHDEDIDSDLDWITIDNCGYPITLFKKSKRICTHSISANYKQYFKELHKHEDPKELRHEELKRFVYEYMGEKKNLLTKIKEWI